MIIGYDHHHHDEFSFILSFLSFFFREEGLIRISLRGENGFLVQRKYSARQEEEAEKRDDTFQQSNDGITLNCLH